MNTTFANGTTLSSSALTHQQVEQAIQLLTCEIVGINPGVAAQVTLTSGSTAVTPEIVGIAQGDATIGPGILPGTTVDSVSDSGFILSAPATASGSVTLSIGADAGAFTSVRVGWQQQGQPAWGVNDDVVILRASISDEKVNRLRNREYATLDSATLSDTITYTRVWRIDFTLYGPNSQDRARLLKSAIFLDWISDLLAPSNLYIVIDLPDAQRVPELFSGQWFERVDFAIRLYEGVTETTTVASIASVEIIVAGPDQSSGFGDGGFGDNGFGGSASLPVIDLIITA